MKKIISIILIFTVLLVAFTVPSKALAVEIVGGSYVAYAILAAALAAAGYTVATTDVAPEVFQGILDSPNSDLIRALIGGTTMYATSKGSVYFNWTASQWATFTDWATTYLAEGTFLIDSVVSDVVVQGSTFNPNLISNYAVPYIVTSNNSFGFQLGNCTFTTVSSGGNISLKLNLMENCYFSLNNASWYAGYVPKVVFASPILTNYNNNYYPTICIGEGLKDNQLATSLAEVNGVRQSKLFDISGNQLYLNGKRIFLEYQSGIVKAHYNNDYNWKSIAPTLNYTTSYTSIIQYMTDVINSGLLLGDWSGFGDDVINPGDNQVEVGIDAYPDYQVGVGADAVPDVIDGTIDIPLDRYIDTPIDLSQDPVPIDFTPWQDKTIDTVPDDVVPDVRVNPTTDIPQNPDIPWADTESYPIDYPIDTTTSDLPADPNPNTPPAGDGANKLKLLPLVLSKFPFCLPWDLYHGVNSFFVTAEAPVFDIPLRSQTAGINETIHIDFNNYQTLANVSRWFFSALWVIILILITRKIVWK